MLHMEDKKKKELFFKEKKGDIVPLYCGYEECSKGHSYGPRVRPSYLIHFCLGGKGSFYNESGKHSIFKGELFLIRPGEVTTYTADENEPWTYVWVAFNGQEAKEFDSMPTVQTYPDDIGNTIRQLVTNGETSDFMLKSLLYRILHEIKGTSNKDINIEQKIKRYIDFNYMYTLTVNNLAEKFGFARSYLFRIFKNYMGIGIKEYITSVRMDRANELLQKGYSVAETSSMVGYDDQFNFSKTYKKYYDVAPISHKGKKRRRNSEQ